MLWFYLINIILSNSPLRMAWILDLIALIIPLVDLAEDVDKGLETDLGAWSAGLTVDGGFKTNHPRKFIFRRRKVVSTRRLCRCCCCRHFNFFQLLWNILECFCSNWIKPVQIESNLFLRRFSNILNRS